MARKFSLLSPGLWLLLAGLAFSGLLGFFGLDNYRNARPVAAGILRGQALTLASSIAALVDQDPSFRVLHAMTHPDIAFQAIIDEAGLQLFHTNPELIGTPVDPGFVRPERFDAGFSERRIRLGTGEQVYEFLTPLLHSDRPLILRLVLHTYKADAVIRRARTGLALLTVLLGSGWVMGLLLYAYARRAARHRAEMAEQRHLAQLGTLGAVLAHEVRNPLSGIKGYAQLLEESLHEPELKGYADQVTAEAIRLEQLVNDLLAYAQPAAIQRASVDPGPLVSRVKALLSEFAARQDVQLNCDLSAWPAVAGDADRLEQLLMNLVLNALQATPAGGTVTISGRRAGRYLQLEVRDTGKGIEPGDLSLIFQPFFTRRARGTGLGLAICKKYAEDMHGSIDVSSSPGQGSRFRVQLPLAPSHRRGGKA